MATDNIEAQFRPTHDERSRQNFVSMVRKHAIIDMRRAMEEDWQDRVSPALEARGQSAKNWRDIEAAMEREPSYRFYSSLRYNAQEMCYLSVLPTVERALPEMIRVAREANKNSAGGSLRLDPNLEIPRYLTALDVHLAPGWTHTEHTADDVAQGAVVAFGGGVFTGQHPFRKHRSVIAQTTGEWIRRLDPNFKPRRLLDLGTTSGRNLLPYAELFPGVELHGIDLGAPVLRYGHAIAEASGIAAHFSQQNAERTNFPDGHFDMIVSSFFFHEVPVKSTKAILRECRRLLAKGGHMVHLELPNESATDNYANFFWNWDEANNNEPFYTGFRQQQPIGLLEEAGFKRADAFAHLVPDFASFGEEKFRRWLKGELTSPQHGLGGWFFFGVHDSQ